MFTDPGWMHPEFHIPGWMHPDVHIPGVDVPMAPRVMHPDIQGPRWSRWIRTGWNGFVRVIELGRNEKLKAILMTQTAVIHYT